MLAPDAHAQAPAARQSTASCRDASSDDRTSRVSASVVNLAFHDVERLGAHLRLPDKIEKPAGRGLTPEVRLDDLRERLSAALVPGKELVRLDIDGDGLDG